LAHNFSLFFTKAIKEQQQMIEELKENLKRLEVLILENN